MLTVCWGRRKHALVRSLSAELEEARGAHAAADSVAIVNSCDLTPITGSSALLLQMITNLVHNAIVHNRPDRGTVWISSATTATEEVVLRIENTGHELTEQLVSTLPEPFQRGAERRRDDHGGVGLGLAIVRSVALAHDGSIALHPRDGGGLHVTVTLPAAPAKAASDSRLTSERPPAGQA